MSIFGNIKTTTMMNDLLLELGNPTIKTIDISLQIVGGIGSSCSVPIDLTVSRLLH